MGSPHLNNFARSVGLPDAVYIQITSELIYLTFNILVIHMTLNILILYTFSLMNMSQNYRCDPRAKWALGFFNSSDAILINK